MREIAIPLSETRVSPLGGSDTGWEVVIGIIVGVMSSAEALVQISQTTANIATPARTVVSLTEKNVGDQVAIAFEKGDLTKPLILGILRTAENIGKKLAITIDDDKVAVTADREIELRCGEASVTLTRAGKVIHQGRICPDACVGSKPNPRGLRSDQLKLSLIARRDSRLKDPQMTTQTNPYDDLPYRSRPIEWTAPERLALTSVLHGGPRQRLDGYRVLELGCADGANLLPLAYYRKHASFVGIDGARTQIEVADARKSALELSNIDFIYADFITAAQRISGQFDYIIAHGVFSWVSDDVRDALLELSARHLRPGGLLYLNYNTRPGWNIRGMVREFLLAQTAGTASLRIRAQMAQDVSARVVSGSAEGAHPFRAVDGERISVCLRERCLLRCTRIPRHR